jgi:hypothetical protein
VLNAFLALHEPLYEEFIEKFFEHTLHIAGAMDRIGINQDEMWDEDDSFYYDVLRFPDGSATRSLRVAARGALRLPSFWSVGWLIPFDRKPISARIPAASAASPTGPVADRRGTPSIA